MVLNITSVPHLKRMYNTNSDLLSELLDYLVSKKRLNEKDKNLIKENEMQIAFSVERK